MKIEALREFIVFARHMNFSAASRELFISQPSLSTHIKDLERDLGFELVKRTRPLCLTELGLEFLNCAQETLAVFDQGVQRCLRLNDNPPVRLLVQSGQPEVAQALHLIKDVPFTVQTRLTGGNVLEQLVAGEIDVLGVNDIRLSPTLLRRTHELGLELFPLFPDYMGLHVSRSNVLAQRVAISRKDFEGMTFVIYDTNYYDIWRELIQGMLGQDVSVTYKLVPLSDQANLAFQSLSDNEVHLCGRDYLRSLSNARDDLVQFDMLDGEDLRLDYLILYAPSKVTAGISHVLDCFKTVASAVVWPD